MDGETASPLFMASSVEQMEALLLLHDKRAESTANQLEARLDEAAARVREVAPAAIADPGNRTQRLFAGAPRGGRGDEPAGA